VSVVADVAVVVTDFQIRVMIFLVGYMSDCVDEAHGVIEIFELE
jgi:hypothetical protein